MWFQFHLWYNHGFFKQVVNGTLERNNEEEERRRRSLFTNFSKPIPANVNIQVQYYTKQMT